MTAKSVYSTALQTNAIAYTLLSEYALASLKISTAVAPDKAVLEVDGVPEWASLFGSIELCGCDHCHSVLSPAAYLVDLLHFLSARPARPLGKTAKDVLFLRRPDLGEIELTCDNTNTPLPYVDLVLEALEGAVAPLPPFAPFALPAELKADLDSRTVSDALKALFTPPLSADAVITVNGEEQASDPDKRWWTIDEPTATYTIWNEAGQPTVAARSRQTTGSAAERSATPQYRNAAAYDVLAQAVYPWSLPLDLGAAEAAAYLGHLDVPRRALIEALQPGGRAVVLTSQALVNETLGLSDAEAKIVVGATTGQPDAAAPGPWQLWGFRELFLSPDNAIPDPLDSTRRIAGGGWLEVLGGRVDVFLQQSGLTYREMLDLLDCYYVNPSQAGERAIHIVAAEGAEPDTCETAKLTLDGLDASAAARIVRFVRLWRRLGWSMRDLDRAATAFGATSLPDWSAALLIRLAHVQRLHADLGVPVVRLLSWWAPIDSARYIDHDLAGQPHAASLYDQLFRNRTIVNPPDPAFVERPDQLAGTLSEHAATIAAALRISADDFVLLLGHGQVIPRLADQPTKPNEELTLDNLSRLHRHASLARALALKVREYLRALELIAPDPFASTTDTLLFVETVGQIRESGFSVAELAYLLRQVEPAERPFSPDESAVRDLLAGLRAGLRQIAADTTFRTDPDDPAGPTADLTGDLTAQKLAILNWEAARVEQSVATLAGAVRYETPLVAPPGGLGFPNASAVYATPLDALPTGFVIPPELADPVAFDGTAKRLTASRRLTHPERALLTEAAVASGDAALAAAVAGLIAEQDALAGDVRHDATRQVLLFSGPMTNARRARLHATNADPAYHAAVEQLYAAPRQALGRQMGAFTVRDFSVTLDLDVLPVKIPARLKGKLYFDATAQPHRLHCLGPMTDPERAALDALAADPPTAAQTSYLAAVQELYQQAEGPPPEADDRFLSEGDVAALLDGPIEPGDRFRSVLAKLLPYLGRALSERLAVQTVAEALDLEPRAADKLLRSLRVAQAAEAPSCLETLLDPAFAESSTSLAPTAQTFPGQHAVYRRTHKAALLVERLKLSFKQIGWLFDHGSAADWLDPNALPLEPDAQSAPLFGWLRLAELARLRDGWRRGEDALDELLAIAHGVDDAATGSVKNAAKEAWCAALIERADWSADDVAVLVGSAANHADGGQLGGSFPEDFTGARLLLRLREAVARLRRLGVTAADGVGLIGVGVSLPQAGRLRQAVRAKYDEAQWLAVAKPLGDVLREQQRAALVAYLVAHLRLPFTVLESPHPPLALNLAQPTTGPAVRELQRKLSAAGAAEALAVDGLFGPATAAAVIAFQEANGLPPTGLVDDATWAELDKLRHGIKNPNALYAHFLVDVEMDPCMVTSRIKQALGSVQLFVQRCLMGLEPDVAAGIDVDDHWRQWKWMKNYRVWEANRRIFLYPENWIEPELRDDKSPFFREMESELLQSDPTDATVEQAFLHYLEKLDQVARLEVVAVHHQLEEDQSGHLAVDVLHVFGRTPSGTPRVYFYRQRVDGVWSPWERIDLDIVTEHLVPVIWNRRLYLFWLIFTVKAEPGDVSVQGGDVSADEPRKYWEVQLAWSERLPSGWSNKRVSAEVLEATLGLSFYLDQLATPSEAFVRVTIDAQNTLAIALLRSAAYESDSLESALTGLDMSAIASQFLTGGGVNLGQPAEAGPSPWSAEVPDVPAFVFAGCHADAVAGQTPPPAVEVVTGTTFDGVYQAEHGQTPLFLPAPTDTTALAATPGRFTLLPHANGNSVASHPTFYQDDWRAYFVEPSREPIPWEPAEPDSANPIALLPDLGEWLEYEQIDPAGPIIDPIDPPQFESSFPVLEV